MMAIMILERDVSCLELEQMSKSFKTHGLEFGVTHVNEIRHTFVLEDGKSFVGCVSGLQYLEWLYITDLWLEESYRKRGFGKSLMNTFESKLKTSGVKHVWTWTAGYEAPPFYQKQGYRIFCEQEKYYASGHSRFGLRKDL